MTFFSRQKSLLLAYIASYALVQVTAGCSEYPSSTHTSDGFLAHLRANSPSEMKECIVAQTLDRWPNDLAIYAAANRIREIRGRTDVVNFAIRSVSKSCRKSQHH
jgi:hypothetical protein